MISILTSTFNRERTLRRLYESLVCQGALEFEWLVVDDGSSDATRNLIEEFIREGIIEIKYYWKKNGGKHTGVNFGVSCASGEWVVLLDSDDFIQPGALARVVADIKHFESSGLVGLAYRTVRSDGSLVGVPLTASGPVSMHPTVASRVIKGDVTYVFRKSALLENPFPVINGESFIPELYIWNRLGDAGSILYFVDSALTVVEYLNDGYSNNFRANLKKNPTGFLIFYCAQIRRERGLFRKLACSLRAFECMFFLAFGVSGNR